MLAVTFNVGDLPYASPALEILRHYFNRCGIPFKVVEDIRKFNTKKAHPSWLKLLVHRMFPNEEFILAWDLDLLPEKDAPNISDLLDKNSLNMVYDTSLVLGYPVFNPQTFKYNGGLIGIPKSLSNWIESIYDNNAPGTYPSWEQYYLNDRIVFDGIKVNRLPDECNCLYPKRDDGWDIWNRSKFKHFGFGGFINPPDILKTITLFKTEYFNAK